MTLRLHQFATPWTVRACTYSYLLTFSIAPIVLSSERVLNMVQFHSSSSSSSSSLYLSAPFAAGKLGNPTLSGVQTLRIIPNLAVNTLTTVCPEHRERKTPDVGGLQCVSRRVEMTLSQTPNGICRSAGWRLRVTRATSSTGVKGGLQNEEGNGATPNISCPAEAAERVEPVLR